VNDIGLKVYGGLPGPHRLFALRLSGLGFRALSYYSLFPVFPLDAHLPHARSEEIQEINYGELRPYECECEFNLKKTQTPQVRADGHAATSRNARGRAGEGGRAAPAAAAGRRCAAGAPPATLGALFSRGGPVQDPVLTRC